MTLLALLPGVLVGASCFLPLISASVSLGDVSGGGHVTALDTTAGKVAVVLAFLAIVLDAVDLRGRERQYRSVTSLLAFGAAVVVAYKGWSLESRLNSATAADVGNALGIAVHASLGVGVWVALIGGVLGTLGRWFLADA